MRIERPARRPFGSTLARFLGGLLASAGRRPPRRGQHLFAHHLRAELTARARRFRRGGRPEAALNNKRQQTDKQNRSCSTIGRLQATPRVGGGRGTSTYFGEHVLCSRVLRATHLVASRALSPGTACLIVYFYSLPEPMMQVVYWNSVFALINAAWTGRLLFARAKATGRASFFSLAKAPALEPRMGFAELTSMIRLRRSKNEERLSLQNALNGPR
jgi:hypothetical protein